MKINNESFSELLNKYTLITIEITRLTALMIYYTESGNKTKLIQTIDAIKRLDANKSMIAIEFDKRIPLKNESTDDNNETHGSFTQP